MKLLFDENLSPRLVMELQTIFPQSAHVTSVGLRGQPDDTVWCYARDHDAVIVSKDNEFRQLSFLKGPPPKVIWLAVGNAGTGAIAALLRQSRPQIDAFVASPEEGLLVLELPEVDTAACPAA